MLCQVNIAKNVEMFETMCDVSEKIQLLSFLVVVWAEGTARERDAKAAGAP